MIRSMSENTKKTQIHQAAAYLFRKKGYRATSMQDIADSLDIKAASLYNHISSKQEILSGLLMSLADRFTQAMDEIESSSLSPKEKLEELINLHVEITLANRDSISLITGEWVHLEEIELIKYREQRNSYEASFLKILRQCKKEGLIESHINIKLALFSILSSLHWLYNWYNRNEAISKVELSKQLRQILLKGILSDNAK